MVADSSSVRVNRRWWCLILGLAWLLHDAEEVLLASQMLRFMQSDAPGFLRDAYAGITASELQAVLLILTALLLIVIASAAVFARAATSAFGMIVLAALLGLNAIFHIGLFLHTSVYVAGLATAVLVSMPVAATVLVHARRQRWIAAPAFWVAVPTAVLVHGPVLDGLFAASLSFVRA